MKKICPGILFSLILLFWIGPALGAPTSTAENLKLLSSPKSAGEFTFIVLGDNRDGDAVFRKLLDQIQKEKEVAFLLHTGDMVSPGIERNYRRFAKMIEPLPFPFFSVLGNHDVYLGGRKNYANYFGNSHYYFDYGNARFIVLDNAEGIILEKEFAWLEELLKKSEGKLLFVALHCPTFDPTPKKKAMADERQVERFEALMDRYGVKYVFFGHNHLYAKRIINGRVEIITGGAGSPFYADREHGGIFHYVKVTVRGAAISDTLVTLKEN